MGRCAGSARAVLVQQARTSTASWQRIGAAQQVSADTAHHRWSPRRIKRLLQEAQQLRREVPAPSSGRVAGRDAAAPGQAPGGAADVPQRLLNPGRTAPAPRAACAGGSPAEQLSAALSQMQRACGRSLRELAKDAGVSPSYVSRLLAGERVPSWGVTRSLAAACGADPAELRPLWEAARTGTRPQHPKPRAAQDLAAAALHDAVCDLYLAAARPSPSDICEEADGFLRTREVTGLLSEGRLPDWHVLNRVISALGGRPDHLRSLWDQACGSTAAQSSARPPSVLG